MASAEDLKLLGTKTSMFVQRVVWALKLKGVEYEWLEEDLVHKSPLLLELNPVHKKVPVLVHGGKPIVESKIIVEYIDETWKQSPLLPEDHRERAYVRFWAAFIDDKCPCGSANGVRVGILQPCIGSSATIQLMEASRKAFASTGEDQAKAVESTIEALKLLAQELQGKKFFGGDEEIGYLDIVAGWIAYWFQFIEEIGGFKAMDSTEFPHLDSWIKNFLQIPSIAQNLPSSDQLRDAFIAIRMSFEMK